MSDGACGGCIDCRSCCPRIARCELHGLFQRAAALGVESGNFCAWRFERCACRAAQARAGAVPLTLPTDQAEVRTFDG